MPLSQNRLCAGLWSECRDREGMWVSDPGWNVTETSAAEIGFIGNPNPLRV